MPTTALVTAIRWLGVMITAVAFALPATGQTTWDGGAKTTSWHDAANWSPDGVPGPNDDVFISNASVVFSQDVREIASLEVSSDATLRIEGGTLSSTGPFTVFGTLEYVGGTIGGEPVLDDADLIIDPAAATVQVRLAGTCTVTGTIGSGHTLLAQSNELSETTHLHASDGLVNHGTIVLEAIDGLTYSLLVVSNGTTFTNGANGVISTTGPRGLRKLHIDGTLINDGLIDIGSYTTSNGRGEIQNSGTIYVGDDLMFNCSIKFEQISGTLHGDGELNIGGDPFTLVNGEFIGRVLISGEIDIRPTVTREMTLQVASATLLAYDSPNVTLWVQTGDLTVADGLVNHGTIHIESIDHSNMELRVLETFTNGPDGMISIADGAGGSRTIKVGGTFINEGLIDIEDRTLSSGNGEMRNAGTIRVAEGEYFRCSFGQFTFVDGELIGEFLALDTAIDVRSTATQRTTLVADGNCSLLAHDSSLVTLQVTDSLIPEDGSVNNGTIALETGGSELFVPKGSTFTNSASGVIRTGDVMNCCRDLDVDGTFINEGLIEIASDTISEGGGEIQNHGTIYVADSHAYYGAVSHFYQSSGTLHADGTIYLAVEHFTLLDGELRGRVLVADSTIDIRPTVTQESTLLVYNTCTLLAHDSPLVTLWVQGNSETGTAELQTTDGLVNNGPILLESTSASDHCHLSVPAESTFTNGTGGTITSNVGAGGTRRMFIDGTFQNFGLVDFKTHMNSSGTGEIQNEGMFYVDNGFNHYCSVEQFKQVAGTLHADGWMYIWHNHFTFEDGTVLGQVAARNATIDIRSTITQESTLLAYDTCTLLAHDSPLVTLWVQGNDQTNSAELQTTDGLVNHGTILLESIDSPYTSELSVPGGTTFTNGIDGAIRVGEGSGGDRYLHVDGIFMNDGTLAPGYPDSLVVEGDYVQSASGRLFTEFAGPSTGEYSHMTVTGEAHLAGTIELARMNQYAPDETHAHVVIDADAIFGEFQNVSACDDNTVDYTAEQTIVYFDVSDVVGDLNNSGSVNVSDLLLLLAEWGNCPAGEGACCPGDLNGDSSVNVSDLLVQLDNWL